MKTVIIVVQGGCIQHISAPDGIEFTIIDHDNETEETYEPDLIIAR